MPEIIIRNRTIRPSTRGLNSKNYKVDTKSVKADDVLIVNINHESNPFTGTYKFKGLDVVNKDSIHFEVREDEKSIEINWHNIKPIR